MKAWKAEECSEGWSAIVYADTRGKARQVGAGRLDCDFVDINISRARKFDEMGPRGPTDQQLFEDHGWWFECDCGLRALHDDGGEWRDGRPTCFSCVDPAADA